MRCSQMRSTTTSATPFSLRSRADIASSCSVVTLAATVTRREAGSGLVCKSAKASCRLVCWRNSLKAWSWSVKVTDSTSGV